MVTLRGRVVDTNTGRPVIGASVSVAGRTVRTDRNGQFIISMPAANYTISVSHRDYSATSRLVMLTADATITVPLVPRVGLL